MVSLLMVFSALNMMFLGMCVCLYLSCWASWICRMMFCAKWQKFGDIWPFFLPIVFLPHYLFSPSGLPLQVCYKFDTVPWDMRLCSFTPSHTPIFSSLLVNLDHLHWLSKLIKTLCCTLKSFVNFTWWTFHVRYCGYLFYESHLKIVSIYLVRCFLIVTIFSFKSLKTSLWWLG